MGFFDKLKKSIKVVTGGAAKVAIEWEPKMAVPGQVLAVKITLQSTGDEVKSKGVYVDFHGDETVPAPPKPKQEEPPQYEPAPDPLPPSVNTDERETELEEDGTEDNRVCSETYSLCGPFVLAPNESKVVEGSVKLPQAIKPTSDEELGCHYVIRGRLEALGTDPSSGYKDIRIAA